MSRAHRRGLIGLAAALAALFATGAAWAGEVVDVRVGLHPRYTRVVVQTTGGVEHSIRRSDGDELRVRLDARGQRRVIASGSGHLRSVSLEPQPDGTTVAVLSLRDSGVSFSEMTLDGPSRLVIDLKRSAVAQAAPARVAEPEPPAAAPEPVRQAAAASSEPEPAGEPAVGDTSLRDSLRDHRRTGALESMGRDLGSDAADLAEGAGGAMGGLAGEASDALSKTVGALEDESDGLLDPDDALEAFNTTSSFREILAAADGEGVGGDTAPGADISGSGADGIEIAQNAAPPSYGGLSGAGDASRSGEAIGDTAAPRKGFTGFLPAAIDHPLILGGVGVVLLLLLIVLILRGQRRSDSFDTDVPYASDEPFSLDAAEVSDAVDGTIPTAPQASAMDGVGSEDRTQPDVPFGGDPDEDLPAVVGQAGGPPPLLGTNEFADEPRPAFGAAAAAPSSGAADEPAAAAGDFGNEPAPSESPFGAPAEPAAPAPAFSGQSDAARSEELFADERLAHLERKLKDLDEAKDRIERQLAAQSEELRVQRAAIARTQRVLRTVARTDDEATEPVPKV
ncbi:MAG: hypothetical protein HKP27_16640 [Myxococcales bacterium]|nr:hypothetical protein [Myxococcales bacterium]